MLCDFCGIGRYCVSIISQRIEHCTTAYRRTGNFRGWKFSRFRDSMYYANISRFLFSRLEVITAKIALPRVKNFTRKLNFANFNFAVRPQPRKPRKFVDRENLPSYGISKGLISARAFVDRRDHQSQPFWFVLNKDKTDEFDLKQIANEIVAREYRLQNILKLLRKCYFYVFCVNCFEEY